MYCSIMFYDSSFRDGEKSANPVNQAIRPKDIAHLTAEGKATAMQQLNGCLYYPEVADGVLPLEFTRGIDENDAWEASYDAQEKVRKYLRDKEAKSSMSVDHN